MGLGVAPGTVGAERGPPNPATHLAPRYTGFPAAAEKRDRALDSGHLTSAFFFSRFIHDILHVSMPFSQIFPPSPSPSPTESIRLFYTSVSLLLSRTQGYCYHLSNFHIYALVYCIGVFLSGLLHSV